MRKTYKISAKDYQDLFISEVNRLKKIKDFDHIVLWFEFDLYCHLNMLASISLITEQKKAGPVYLVCSKKLNGDENLKALSQLTPKQLKNHYDNKILLSQEDLEIANLIWELYCSNNPIKLKPLIKTSSNFEYLSSCIRAHIERFPNSTTGLNSLEKNILKLIAEHTITSKHQLLGYALQYQGYYGYSDNQMERLLKKLKKFYSIEPNKVQLTKKGEEVLAGTKNFYQEIKNDDCFGGAKMYDFLYDSEEHRLLKL